MSEHTSWSPSARELVLLSALSAVAALAYVFQIDARSLWLDEVMSLNAAAGSWEEKWRFFQGLPEQHPLYYVLLTGWVELGESELVLRGFSVVWGVATVPVLYVLTRRLFGIRVAVLSTLLLAVSPYWVYYSQEARMYTFLGFLTVLSHLVYVWWVEQDSVKGAVAYVLVGVLGVYTHLFFLFVPMAHVVAAWWAEKRFTLATRKIAIAAAAIYVAYLPWVWVIVSNMPEGQSWKGFRHLAGGVPYALLRFSIGYAELTPFQGWKDQIVHLVTENWPRLAAVYGIFGGTLLVGAITSYRRGRNGKMILSAGVVPVVGMYLLSVVTVLVGVKYLTVVFPVFVILVALGVTDLLFHEGRVRRTLGIALGVLVVAFTGKALADHYRSEASPKADWRDAANLVADTARPGDGVVFHKPFVRSPFMYYYRRTQGSELREIGNHEALLPSTVERVWVVVSHVPGNSPCTEVLVDSKSSNASELLVHERFRNGAGIEAFLLNVSPVGDEGVRRDRLRGLLRPCLPS